VLVAILGALLLRQAGNLTTTMATLAASEREVRLLADNGTLANSGAGLLAHVAATPITTKNDRILPTTALVAKNKACVRQRG
jgi:hypothetical protein